MQFDADADGESQSEVDVTVENRGWSAVPPSGALPTAVQVVDGVRRVEAHAMDEGPDGLPVFGLFGSYAVGVVRCEGDRARILDERMRVERCYLQAGGEPEDQFIPVQNGDLRFVAKAEPASTANGLIDALNRLMLDEEAKLAEELSRDESTLTLVDGPLRTLRSPGRRVVGYVKRIVNWYVGPEEQRLLLALATGERTPLFRITDSQQNERYSWFLRIADLGAHFHPLGGIMRLEAPGTLPLAQAVALADQATLVLPRLASTPARDPRAPQNLVPVGALESRLTHRLGDRAWVSRLLNAHAGREAARATGAAR